MTTKVGRPAIDADCGPSHLVATQAVDAALADAATAGERIASRAKIIFGVLTFLAWSFVSWGRWLFADLFLLGLCLVLIAHSAALLAYLRRHQATLRLHMSSIVIEAAMIGAVPLSWILTREETWFGAGKLPGTYAVMLAISVAGFRLSRRAVVLSTVLNSLWLALLFVLDANVEGLAPFSISDWIVIGVLALAASASAYLFTARARVLALEVASQTERATHGRNLLGAYLSKELAAKALAETELRLGGDRKKAAVMFVDLRGFTKFAEGLDPQDLVAQLNRYLAVVVDVITQHGGVVDKYTGDGVMAVFGVPETHRTTRRVPSPPPPPCTTPLRGTTSNGSPMASLRCDTESASTLATSQPETLGRPTARATPSLATR